MLCSILAIFFKEIFSYTDDKSGTSLVIEQNEHGQYQLQESHLPRGLFIREIVFASVFYRQKAPLYVNLHTSHEHN
jgi:hypothetical protein